MSTPAIRLAGGLLAVPLRLARWYGRLRREAAGMPGVRCGICGERPDAGERLCFDCWANQSAAP